MAPPTTSPTKIPLASRISSPSPLWYENQPTPSDFYPTSDIATDVVKLPRRHITIGELSPLSLRSAFTIEEVISTENDIKNMSTIEEVYRLVGRYGGGLLLSDQHLINKFQLVDVAHKTLLDLKRLRTAADRFGKPPTKFIEEFDHLIQCHNNQHNTYIDDILKNLNKIKTSPRANELNLRNEDYAIVKFGRWTLKNVHPNLKETRKFEVCDTCNRRGHKETDHYRYSCWTCKTSAPGHNSAWCPNRRKNKKKSKFSRFGSPLYEPNSPSDDSWGMEYDDWVCEEAEHNLAT